MCEAMKENVAVKIAITLFMLLTTLTLALLNIVSLTVSSANLHLLPQISARREETFCAVGFCE